VDDVETKADAFLEATELHVAEAGANGLPPIAVARLLFGYSVLLMERRDGVVRTAEAMRHQLKRLENNMSPLP